MKLKLKLNNSTIFSDTFLKKMVKMKSTRFIFEMRLKYLFGGLCISFDSIYYIRISDVYVIVILIFSIINRTNAHNLFLKNKKKRYIPV